MTYQPGTLLIDRESGLIFIVKQSTDELTTYQGDGGSGVVSTADVRHVFIVEEGKRTTSALDVQEGGDHYKKLGHYQPWEVLERWLTPEGFRGYMKGTAIAYLAREQDKGGTLDIKKATHTLQGLIEILGDR